MSVPRNEYPRPQLVRKDWINLNGAWDFEIDDSFCGQAKKYQLRNSLNDKIIVPFCPESKLSGVQHTDFISCVWYRKNIEIPTKWMSKNIILHFGAVDYHSTVYVNGEYIGEHKGGYTSFCFDITKFLREKENYITICAKDDLRSNNQPSGKQSPELNSFGCFYTRTTGIWQTVWLECVSTNYIKGIKTTTDIETCSVSFEIRLSDNSVGCKIKSKVYFNGEQVGESATTVYSFSANLNILLAEKHLWDVGQGNLYDVIFTVEKGNEVTDTVDSYFGLRSIGLSDKAFLLNGRKVFGRWVLDQGFYPDGIYTAPNDEALKDDIIKSMQLGFNGARLHEKVFEPRFLYWADKLGYLVWGEHANWGLDITEFTQLEHFLPEWMEAVERDFNHPSIIGWCPFNETWDFNWRRQNDILLRTVYNITKAMDSTRPVIDTSGNFHGITDIYDIHDYNQSVEQFSSHYINGVYNNFEDRQSYKDQPYFVSEYGGIKWSIDETQGWGYGDSPKTEKEFIERYKGLTEALLNDICVIGFCYTQLYDVEQELNGLMTYSREFKFNPEIIKAINTQKAVIEE
ncbi:MAG: beta-galactosidase [Clostridiales bacterium GWF2_38_85]|nr:MAG: beta-galactosidase [Clostridiales bacterium GWF2_38_85]